ncbi:MAG TPA: STAS domain-containing protein [Candidatus Limnocylindrales bacterium]|nr:STAS domain-containing protein [Candidatus Limnocylindrales bacterium]
MGLQIAIRQSGNVTILDLQGKATIGRPNDELSAQLRKLIDSGTRNVVLNLEHVIQIDSSSLSTIVRALTSLRTRSGSLCLLRPHGNVLLVLDTLHLREVIPCFDDEPSAFASFSES